ncbi:hypothetical protein [Aetokthonos hydrillicola]|nr:hypothetical protein [Aetokthonos hydrillicola]
MIFISSTLAQHSRLWSAAMQQAQSIAPRHHSQRAYPAFPEP